ncbi:unnamed protein product [Calypogeia fissa]
MGSGGMKKGSRMVQLRWCSWEGRNGAGDEYYSRAEGMTRKREKEIGYVEGKGNIIGNLGVVMDIRCVLRGDVQIEVPNSFLATPVVRFQMEKSSRKQERSGMEI